MSQRAREILEQLNDLDEDIKIEAKLCEAKADRSVMESICAFANEPGLGGGEIILGVSADVDDETGEYMRYTAEGVADTDGIQSDIATKCASMFNPFVSSIFHETNLAETKGSGLGVMRRLMEDAGMMPPTYESDRTNNLSYRQLCGIGRAKALRDLKRLCKVGLLTTKGKSSARYYVPTEALEELIGGMADDEKGGMADEKGGMVDDGKGGMLDTKGGMPEELKKLVSSLGKKTRKEHLYDVVEALCGWQPMDASEISKIISRDEKYIQEKIIRPMKEAGRIEFTIPDMIKHPNQKYRKTTIKGRE